MDKHAACFGLYVIYCRQQLINEIISEMSRVNDKSRKRL